jgi:glycosyltransferase involved in cell wall biosynthesis
MRLFVVEPLGSGGMIHYAYQLCTALAKQGASVTLVTSHEYELDAFPHNFTVEKRMRLWKMFDPSSSQPPWSLLGRLWRKLRWTARRAKRGLQLVGEWARLTNFLLEQQPDLIQFGKINFPFEALFLARLRWRGLILTEICHEFELRERSGGPLTALANQLYANVYGHFSAIFFHAESNRQRFLSLFQVPRERLHIIPLGNESLFLGASTERMITPAALRQRYGLGAQDPVVLFFGTITPSKGVPDLLQAFALVHEQNPHARLVIAGFPTKFIDQNDLQRLAVDLGITQAVTFDARYIPIEEVASLMALASVVVYPYRNSTQSAALQAAYTFGRPVIATTVGGLPEAVENGRSGFLVPPETPKALASAILQIINNPHLAAEMGAYARHLSETRFSWTSIANQILTVYHGLSDS